MSPFTNVFTYGLYLVLVGQILFFSDISSSTSHVLGLPHLLDTRRSCPHVVGNAWDQYPHVLTACEVDWGPLIIIDGESCLSHHYGNLLAGNGECPISGDDVRIGTMERELVGTTVHHGDNCDAIVTLANLCVVSDYFDQSKCETIRFKFREPDDSNLMVLHRDWAHSTINDGAGIPTSWDDTVLIFTLVAIMPCVKACLRHDLLAMGRSSITGIPHIGSVTDYNRAFSVDNDAPSKPLVKLVLGNPSFYVDAPGLYDLVMGRPTFGILGFGLLVEASACWKRTKLKRYESCTMLGVTTSEVAHRGDRVARTAECFKVAQLVDPQDLDRGVDPDDDHGLTHHRSVMVHVDPPPPPEPPPCIHHPPCCRIDLVNQEPSLRFVINEILPVAWYSSVRLISVKTATLVTVDVYTVDFYTNYGDTSIVSGFRRRDRLLDLLLSVRYLGIPSRGESDILCDYEFVGYDSLQQLRTITDVCRDVRSLCRFREAINNTVTTGRYRFSNIARDNIPANILREHWCYLPVWQHMFKVLWQVDGEMINSPMNIHEDNDIETQ